MSHPFPLLECEILLFELLDCVKHIQSHSVAEAVNEVLAQVPDGLHVRLAGGGAKASKELRDFFPLLSIHENHTDIVKQAFRINHLVSLHVPDQLVSEHEFVALLKIFSEGNQSFPQLLTNHRVKRVLRVLTTENLELSFVLGKLVLGSINVETNNLVVDRFVELFFYFFSHDDLTKLVAFVVHEVSDHAVEKVAFEVLQGHGVVR